MVAFALVITLGWRRGIRLGVFGYCDFLRLVGEVAHPHIVGRLGFGDLGHVPMEEDGERTVADAQAFLNHNQVRPETAGNAAP